MDTYGKYIRLFGNIFFTFIGFIVALLLFMLCMKLFFNLLSFMPWTVYIYMLFLVAFPASVFIPVYIIYARRTRWHVSTPVRYFSYLLFTVALAAWGYALVTDMIVFFQHYYPSISYYKSYELAFLAGNVALLFFIGIVQALTTAKEKDWMEKHNS